MRPKVAFLLSLLMAGILVLLAVGSRSYYQRAAVEHFQRQIESAEEDQVPQLMSRLCGLGVPGIRALVSNLNSSRECVALSARWLLLEQLARWRNQPAPEAMRWHLAVAEALCESVPQFGTVGRQSAEQLVVRMLLELPDADTAQRQQVLEHCRRVLEAVGAADMAIHRQSLPNWDVAPPMGTAGVPAGPSAQTRTEQTSPPGASGNSGTTGRAIGRGANPAELARLPGGGLMPPFEPATLPGDPFAADRSGGQAVASDAQPGGYSTVGPSSADDQHRAADGSDELPPPQRLPSPSQRPKAIPKTGIGPRTDVGEGVHRLGGTDGEDAGAVQEAPRSANDGAPLRPTSLADEATSGSAGQQSPNPNLHPVEMELARRLADPDPQVRKQLVRVLPQLQAVDPTAWLLRLCEDVDAEVRLEAMTLLATSGNPALLAQVRKLARQDSNPRIRQLAEQLDRR